VVIIQTGIAYLDDDALVAWPGEAEFAGLGHDARDYRRDRPRLLTVIIRCDWPSSSPSSHRHRLPAVRVRLSVPKTAGDRQ
jgi:hypothetical protein